MATFFSDTIVDYWSSTTNYVYGTLTGDVSRSGNTVTLSNMRLTLTSRNTSYGSASCTYTVNGTSTTFTVTPSGTNLGTHSLNNTSFSVGTTQTSASVSWSGPDGTYSGSFTVTFPSGATAPSGGFISSYSAGIDHFIITGGVTSMGQGGSQTYVEHIVANAAYTGGQPQRYEGFNSLSATKTVNNSSPIANGGVTISPNTRYYLGIYADNGVLQYRYNYGAVATLPPTPTSITAGTQSYASGGGIRVPITLVYPSDGGYYTKQVQQRYSMDGGVTWTSWANADLISGGSAGSRVVNFVFSPATTYQLQIRFSTSAGVSPSSVSTTFTTMAAHRSPYIESWEFAETVSQVAEVLETGGYFIQGISRPRMNINETNLAIYDGATLSKVEGKFDGVTQTLERSGDVYTALFPAPTTNGDLTAQLTLTDSLAASTTATKTAVVLPYADPTVNVSYTRADETGASDISFAGQYGTLAIDDIDKNAIQVFYRLRDSEGVITDWTEITPELGERSNQFRQYTGLIQNVPTDFSDTYVVDVRTVDKLATTEASVTISNFDDKRILKATQWDIEVWTRQGTYLADISRYLQGEATVTWTLNDVESVSFDVSLDALEMLKSHGVSVVDLLTPYMHDIRIRRNGTYIVGCNIVDSSISIGNDSIPVLKIKATGYLNLFKDRYFSRPLSEYIYPRMAQKLIHIAQEPDCLIKNPTGDIDASYWLSPQSSIAQTTNRHSGGGAIQCVYSTTGWRGMGTQMKVPAGTQIQVDFWGTGLAGPLYVRERELVTKSSNQSTIGTFTVSTTGTYQHFTSGAYTTKFTDGYIYFEQDQSTNTPIRLDDVFVFRADDTATLNNQYVQGLYGSTDDSRNGPGHDYAPSTYTYKDYDYELQNVKDAIMDLTQMGTDTFDFEFTPDKIFNVYGRKGADKPQLELCYPGNVASLDLSRTAQDMANKIQVIGSGIGDERLEAWALDTTSMATYGAHESVVTENNISLMSTLQARANGLLDEKGDLKKSLKVTIQDGSINCANVETGDSLPFRTELYQGVLENQTNITSSPLDGTFRLTCELDGELYALSGDSATATGHTGPRVILAPFNSEDPLQQWRIIPLGYKTGYWETVRLMNCGIPRDNDVYRTYRWLDLGGGSTEEGNTIQTWIWSETNTNMRWQLAFREGLWKVMLRPVTTGEVSLGVNENKEAIITANASGIKFDLQKINAVSRISLLENLEGWYKIKQMTARFSKDNVESLDLTLDYESSF